MKEFWNSCQNDKTEANDLLSQLSSGPDRSRIEMFCGELNKKCGVIESVNNFYNDAIEKYHASKDIERTLNVPEAAATKEQ